MKVVRYQNQLWRVIDSVTGVGGAKMLMLDCLERQAASTVPESETTVVEVDAAPLIKARDARAAATAKDREAALAAKRLRMKGGNR